MLLAVAAPLRVVLYMGVDLHLQAEFFRPLFFHFMARQLAVHQVVLDVLPDVHLRLVAPRSASRLPRLAAVVAGARLGEVAHLVRLVVVLLRRAPLLLVGAGVDQSDKVTDITSGHDVAGGKEASQRRRCPSRGYVKSIPGSIQGNLKNLENVKKTMARRLMSKPRMAYLYHDMCA